MSWLDRYLQASFRNVKFYVPSHEHIGGRRNAVHELPGRDVPDVRDLGSKIKRYNFEAYVIGEDYDITRNALLDALDRGGVGKLVHPYLGTIRVSVESYNLREQSTETRIARFSINFIQSGLQQYPQEDVAPSEEVSQKKSASLSAIQNDFEQNYDITNQTYSVVQNVKDNLDICVERMEQNRKVVSVSSEFQSDLNYIKANLASLAFDSEALGSSFLNLINFGSDLGLRVFTLTPENARIQYDEQRNLWQSFDSVPLNQVNSTDPSDILTNLMQRVAVVSAAGLFSVMDFSSWDEAKDAQTVLYDKMQELAEASLDDEFYATIQDLQVAVFNDFESRDFNLPRLIEYTPNITTNTLFLSHYLYGDIEREQEIIDRNKINHPGFVPGKVSLEVIVYV